MGSEYDENLVDNSFFKYMQEHVDILKKASENQWILCVPRSGTFDKKYTKVDILEHILVKNDTPLPHYYNMNRRHVTVHNKLLITKTDVFTTTVRILFDEIFYVGGNSKYIVWCVNAPLNQRCASNPCEIIEIHNLRDCIDFLWIDDIGCVILEKINDSVETFLNEHALDRLDLQEQKELVKDLYEQCLGMTLANNDLQSKICDANFLNNLHVAVEMYMQTCLGKQLFNSLCTYTSFTDANFNKIIRNVQDIPLKAFSIEQNCYEYLPFAKNELNKLNRSCTTLDKLNCLKSTLNVLSSRFTSDKNLALNADNLVEIFAFLIVKSSIHNWITNLIFIKEFWFSMKNSCDENNFLITTLQAAIECIKTGQLSMKLIDFDLNCANSNLKLLFRSIFNGNLDEVRNALLTNQSNNNNSVMPLCHPLCSCDKCEKLLLKSNSCEINSCDEKGHTSLHIACKLGHLEIIDFLIQKGADVNRSDCSGNTPLHLAVSKGQQQATLLLLHSGANTDLQDYEGNTPLHIAVRNGHENCVKVLIYCLNGRNQLNINCINNAGDSPLHFASKFGYANLVKILIQYGAKIKRNKQNLTPNDVAHSNSVIALLAYAIIEEQVNQRRNSLQENSSVDNKKIAISKKKWTSFSLGHDYKNRRSFVNFGVRPKNLDHFKKVDLLMKSIENNDLPLTCFYLGIPSPSITCDSQPSCHPLCTCEKCSGENAIEPPDTTEESKQKENLNINICNSEGFTCVHIAAKYGRLDILRMLLDAGALINLKTYKTFYTPLHLACINQRVQIVREMLKCGDCNLDVLDSEGNTPLHYACFKNDVRIFELLFSQGADTTVKNNLRKTVLNEAEERNFLNIVKILKDHGVRKHSSSDLKEFDAAL